MATIILGAGNDTVAVSEGPVVKINAGANAAWNNQVIDGAGGIDTLSVNESSTKSSYFTVAMSNDGIVTLTAASGAGSPSVSVVNFEKVQFWDLIMTLGSAGNDAMTGTSSIDNLYGFTGNDTIDGGVGNDKMYGGLGNDTYIVSAVGDIVSEKSGEGKDTIKAGITFSLADTDGAGANGGNVENLTLTGTGAINGTGNGLANILIGNSAANTLNGGLGNDKIDGGAGVDVLIGGAGNDAYTVDNTTETVTELANEGTDSVKSSVTFSLSNNVENLTLVGNAAINATGNAGANKIIGNNGANVITGGLGKDSLSGKGGADTFDFNSIKESAVGAKSDIITDFSHGIDHIDLSNIDANINTGGNNAFTFLTGNGALFSGAGGEVRFYTSGATTVVEADIDGIGGADIQISLTGSIAFNIGDFIL